MAEEEDSADKPYEATPRKLQEARKKGEVPLSQDLVTAAVFMGVLVAAALFGKASVTALASSLVTLLDQPFRLSEQAFGGGSVFLGGLMAAIIPSVIVWFAAPVIFALLSAVVQNALVFAPTKAAPKLSRISPISTAKQKFGREGLFNFFKSSVKLAIYCAVLALVGSYWASSILSTPAFGFEASILLAVSTTSAFMIASLGVMLTIGAIDYIWQRAQHLRKHRMSLKELKDESKETEGDPHTKQARRQKAYDIVTNQMINDVPKADVVIVNPEHYAVALVWSRGKGTAPVCVAKGVDEVAARIRRAANENNVPIHRDPPTARALFATVDLGQEIQPEHYRNVAAAIRFADAIRAKSRGR